jgi:hypothetical protein
LANKSLARSKRVKIPVFKGGSGLLPGVDLTNNSAIWDILDGVQ